MAVISEYGLLLITLTCVFGFIMAWGVGANDVANAMGTSVGSKALTIKQAILIAMVFEFAGAYLAGGEVTGTIRKGIVDPQIFELHPELLVFGMMSALLAAGIWLAIASWKGWPVSTTHSIVGAIVGFAAVGVGVDAVKWGKVTSIVMSWVVSPVLSGTMAFFIFRSVSRFILDTEDPFKNAKRYVPFYMFFVGFMIAMVTLLKGLKHVGLSFTFLQATGLAVIAGLMVMGIGAIALSRIKVDEEADHDFRFASVEKIFAVLMIFTACAMAFAHGSNDVANAIGPLAAVVSVISNHGEIVAKSALPGWVLLLGGGGIVVGLATFGYKVMGTVGRKITELTPSRGFSAELAAATTVVVASGTGLPVSTTHTLVGAVLGVGLARGISALNLRVIGNIVASWIITLPSGALLSILFFFLFRALFT